MHLVELMYLKLSPFARDVLVVFVTISMRTKIQVFGWFVNLRKQMMLSSVAYLVILNVPLERTKLELQLLGII